MMDFRFLRHLWYFLAVAEERHFGRAAARLGISQPPLTQQIQILEHVLGVTLFERSRTGVTLTPEGAAILPAVRQLADHAQRLEATIRDARVGGGAPITIGTITSAMFDFLPRLLRKITAAYPKLTVSLLEMDTADALDALKRGDIDLAFVRSPNNVGAIRVEPLSRDQLVVALPVEHRLAKFQKVDIAELADEAMVMFPRRVSPAYFDSIVSACHDRGFSPRAMHEVSSVHSQIGFVACGIGIALVPNGMSRRDLPGVVFRPLKDQVDLLTIAAAWNASRSTSILENIVEMAKQETGVSNGMLCGSEAVPAG